jgi:organic hydroperoxide reductase OsmC/OhrA
VASKAGFVVESYRDAAIGTLTKNERGVPWVAKVTLAPQIRWGERRPSIEEEDHLHEAAHDGCFIAQSVKTEITVTPVR